jgi:N-acetylmuramoyl-L-alanine amidase/putative methionine-R-sulfoxide reductase with GAF domain
MATTPTKPDIEMGDPLRSISVPGWTTAQNAASGVSLDDPAQDLAKPSPQGALQALLGFSALHDQVRRRKALATRHLVFDAKAPVAEFEPEEQFVLDEVLQLVAERAVSITGADGLAIALAQNNEIVLRAAAGTVRPDVGARIDRDSAFSGASFRTAQVFNCDDTETDPRVNLEACRKLGARSMVAVPLCGRRRVIGLLEAFSSWPFGFNDSDVRNLTLLAELVLAALKPEDEDRFADSAQIALSKLEPKKPSLSATLDAATAPIKVTPPPAPPKPISAPAASGTPSPKPSAEPVAPAVLTAKPALVADAALEVKSTSASDAAAKASATEPALSTVEAAAMQGPAVGETAAEPALTFGETEAERASKRPWIPILLVGIVVCSAFAVGVWWKLNTAQLSDQIVHNESKPVEQAISEKKAGESSAPNSNSATAAGTGVAADQEQSQISPAGPQELSKFPHVTGVRHWSSPDSSTVVLDVEDQVQYEAHRLASPDRVYFDLHDTQLAPELANKSIEIGDPFISRIRVAQPAAGMTRVVLETKADTNFSVSLEPNPYRLIVEVRKIGINPKGAVNLFPNSPGWEKNTIAIIIPPPTKEDLQLRARVPKMRIVVDAGHGGWDLGTVGRRGLLEKDLVLEIAERLGKLLESRLGADVIYTRQDDNYIPLDERAEIANQAQADLFVSVHANYSDLPSARGVETYYTNFFSAPGSKEAGAKDADSHSVAGSLKNAVTPTLSPADLHDRIEQSRRLAASVQRSLYGTLSVQNPGLRDRGIKEAGFVVLTESAMPGILAEVSFVSSPTDEQKLRSDGYREQIAEALYRGIARYAANSKGLKLASAAK